MSELRYLGGRQLKAHDDWSDSCANEMIDRSGRLRINVFPGGKFEVAVVLQPPLFGAHQR